MSDEKYRKYMVVGYAPRESVMYADLEDFKIGMSVNLLELKQGLMMGNYPPGLILMVNGCTPEVVIGRYGTVQRMEPLYECAMAMGGCKRLAQEIEKEVD